MMKMHPKAKTLMWSYDDNVSLDGVGGVGLVKTNADKLIKCAGFAILWHFAVAHLRKQRC